MGNSTYFFCIIILMTMVMPFFSFAADAAFSSTLERVMTKLNDGH